MHYMVVRIGWVSVFSAISHYHHHHLAADYERGLAGLMGPTPPAT